MVSTKTMIATAALVAVGGAISGWYTRQGIVMPDEVIEDRVSVYFRYASMVAVPLVGFKNGADDAKQMTTPRYYGGQQFDYEDDVAIEGGMQAIVFSVGGLCLWYVSKGMGALAFEAVNYINQVT